METVRGGFLVFQSAGMNLRSVGPQSQGSMRSCMSELGSLSGNDGGKKSIAALTDTQNEKPFDV